MHGFRPLYITMSWCCSVRLHHLPWNNAMLCFHPLYIYLDPVLFVYLIFHGKKKKKKIQYPVFFLRIIIPWSCPVRLHNLPWNNSMLSFLPLYISSSCSVLLHHFPWNNVTYCFLPFYISWSCSVRLHHLPWNNVMHCFRPLYISWCCFVRVHGPNLPRKNAMPCFLLFFFFFFFFFIYLDPVLFVYIFFHEIQCTVLSLFLFTPWSCSLRSQHLRWHNAMQLFSSFKSLDPVPLVHIIFHETMQCTYYFPWYMLILFYSFTSFSTKQM